MARSYPVFVLFSLLYIASQATYPALCIRTLSAFSPSIQPSTKQLAEIAISVTLDRARSAEGFVSRVKTFGGLKKMEYQAISDCVWMMTDAVVNLNRTAQEMKLIGEDRGKEFSSHISDMSIWLSGVVTDSTTCVDGFADLEGKIKDSVTARVTNVTQAATNAFSLVDQLGSEK